MMRVSDHYAVIVVDGKPVKESNVRINFQPATNTFVATCEIPYTHGANFAIHYYYKHTDRCYTATAMVDGQFAASMIRDPALMPKDKPLKHEGFITTRGVRLFRWARMARREDGDETSQAKELPPDASTIALILSPITGYTSSKRRPRVNAEPLSASGMKPAEKSIKPALVSADQIVPHKAQQNFVDIKPDSSRPKVMMKWQYLLEDLIIERRGQDGLTADTGDERTENGSETEPRTQQKSRQEQIEEEKQNLQAQLAALKQESQGLGGSREHVKRESAGASTSDPTKRPRKEYVDLTKDDD